MKLNKNLAILLLSSLAFTACKKNESADKPTDTTPTPVAKLSFSKYEFAAKGNTYQAFYSGEDYVLDISVINSGTETASGVRAKYSTTSSYLTIKPILSNSSTNIYGYSTERLWSSFSFTLSPLTPANTTIAIQMQLTDAKGNSWKTEFSITTKETYIVSTLAGSDTKGFADGNGASAQFNRPVGIAVDAAGNVYVSDYENQRIRKITPSGTVSTLAGSGTAGYADGSGATAQFNKPNGLAVDATGNVYVADQMNHRIRKVTPDGTVSTLAGSGTEGFADGNGTSAQFNTPQRLAVDATGNVYVADGGNHRIRKITPSGTVSTLAGSGTAGYADGNGANAQFNYPGGVAVDAAGNVYVADYENHRIRKITPSGTVSTLAGSGKDGFGGTYSFADGNGASAEFASPAGVAVDAAGNVYVAQNWRYHLIRKITPSGTASTLAGHPQISRKYADGNGASAGFSDPSDVAVDAAGNLYVADTNNFRIRKITKKQ
ncbi:MAG: hypothetical protein K2Q03_06300 [Sphingobacteriaceae bacterium]|nr:hypothetical protein [Sphingobacteriaceae bacterium]